MGTAVLAGLGVASLANGHRPFQRHGAVSSMASWVSGVLASEVPLVCASASVATATMARRRRANAPATARAVAAVSAATAVGFLDLYRRSLSSGEVLEAALCECLGRDAAQLRASSAEVSPPAGSLFGFRRRYTTDDSTGIVYGDGGLRNTLDVWRRPDAPTSGAPVLIQIHGGAWATGDNRTQALPLVSQMVEAGWVCVLPRYRLSPRATWPDHIVDIMRVISWTKQNIASFGGDPEFVALTGGSAGGHLSSLAALAHDHIEFKPGFEDHDTRVQAVATMYGSYDWLDRDSTANPHTQRFVCEKVIKLPVDQATAILAAGSPRSHVRADAPPFFVVHGRNDSLLPVEQARSFVSALRAVSSAPVGFAELPIGQHAFDGLRTPRARAAAAAVRCFLEVVHADHHTAAVAGGLRRS
ncbi:MAG: alpha/beta hydrolase fold domain-containing protein [Acidimicrobiia bacterium]